MIWGQSSGAGKLIKRLPIRIDTLTDTSSLGRLRQLRLLG